MTIGLGHYLAVAAIMFTLGIFGAGNVGASVTKLVGPVLIAWRGLSVARLRAIGVSVVVAAVLIGIALGGGFTPQEPEPTKPPPPAPSRTT